MIKPIFSILLVLLLTNCFAQDYWEPVDIPDSVEIKTIDIAPSGDLMMGTNKGLYISYNDGRDWKMVGDSNIYARDFAFTNTGELFAGSANIYKLDLSDSSWQFVNYNPRSKIKWYFTSNDVFIIGGWGNIARSVDYGYNWDTTLSDGTSHSFEDFIELCNITFCGSTDYIFPEYGGIYTSNDDGINWTQNGLEGTGVHDLEIDLSNNILAGSSSGLYISQDTGNYWNKVFNDPVYSVATDIFGGIYIGVTKFLEDAEIKYSDNNGQSWMDISDGLAQTSYVGNLKINKNNFIFARIFDNENNLYRSINPIVGIDESTQSSQDLTCFPNPCSNYINIAIPVRLTGNLSVSIYHAGGNLVFREKYPAVANNSQLCIDLHGYQKGLYVVEIVSNKKVFKSKFLVNKFSND